MFVVEDEGWCGEVGSHRFPLLSIFLLLLFLIFCFFLDSGAVVVKFVIAAWRDSCGSLADSCSRQGEQAQLEGGRNIASFPVTVPSVACC